MYCLPLVSPSFDIRCMSCVRTHFSCLLTEKYFWVRGERIPSSPSMLSRRSEPAGMDSRKGSSSESVHEPVLAPKCDLPFHYCIRRRSTMTQLRSNSTQNFTDRWGTSVHGYVFSRCCDWPYCPTRVSTYLVFVFASAARRARRFPVSNNFFFHGKWNSSFLSRRCSVFCFSCVNSCKGKIFCLPLIFFAVILPPVTNGRQSGEALPFPPLYTPTINRWREWSRILLLEVDHAI